MIDSTDACVYEFIKRDKITIANQLVTSLIYNCYFTMNKKEWLDQENQEYRHSTELRFKEFYLKYKSYYEAIDRKEKDLIIMGIKNRMFTEGLMMESITFDDWIKQIINL